MKKATTSILGIALAGVLALLAAPTRAATITRINLPGTGTDAASGISVSNVYTHAVEIEPATDLTINGVVFDGQTLPVASSTGFLTDDIRGNTFSLSTTTGTFLALSSVLPLADGQMLTLLKNYTVENNTGATLPVVTLTLNGLTPGIDYSTRLYAFSVDPVATARTVTVGTNADGLGSSQVIEWSANPQGTAFYVDVNYVASSSSAAITLTAGDVGNPPFLSGFSNQEVPEPTIAALLLGGGALLAFRRCRSETV